MKRVSYSFLAFAVVAAFAVGCDEIADKGASRTLSLPDAAQVVAEGPGDLKYRIPDDGCVFVYDADEQAVIGIKHVRAGQRFVLSPDANGATLDGRRVIEHDLKRNHSHRLYFVKE